MKILKYSKINKNEYKLFFDDGNIIKLYDEIILEYKLLFHKEIDEDTYNKILLDNNNYEAYNIALLYINKKLRCEKELRVYLEKKGIKEENIKKVIVKLKENGYMNDKAYISAYANDKFNLSNEGPIKIKKDLKKLGFSESLVDDLVEFNDEEINEKLEKLINKKIKGTKGYSGDILKQKIEIYFSNLGYNKKNISRILENKDLFDENEYIKEYNKLIKKYERKYSGKQLEQIVKQKLYLKGYRK